MGLSDAWGGPKCINVNQEMVIHESKAIGHWRRKSCRERELRKGTAESRRAQKTDNRSGKMNQNTLTKGRRSESNPYGFRGWTPAGMEAGTDRRSGLPVTLTR